MQIIGSMEQLERLEIYDLYLPDELISPLVQMKSLRELSLVSLRFTSKGFAKLTDMKNLEYIYFAKHPLGRPEVAQVPRTRLCLILEG
jgi:hypothetical protein